MNPAAYGSLPADACTLGAEGSHGPDRITKTIYDAAGQVLQIRKAVGTPIEIADVTYSYTDNGKIKQVVDANGNRAELRYDGHDRQTRWVFPSKTRPSNFNAATPASAMASAGALNEGDYEEYTYDDNGNRLTLRKRDGRKIAFTYDALNRVTKKDLCSSGSASCSALPSIHRRDVFYQYDLRGLQMRARFDSINGPGITYNYDGFGRLASETQNTDGVSRTVTSQYDANGNRTRLTHPDGQFFRLDYDGLNRAIALRQSNTAIGTARYNERGLPEAMNWDRGSDKNERSFDYDNAGRLNEIAIDMRGTNGDVTWGYTRNPASQILSESQNNDSYSWDGHANINRNYTTNGLNQYVSAGSASFCYDANGNLTADGSNVYLYDVENRLVERRVQGANNTNCDALSYSGASTAKLRYDPTGRLYGVKAGSAPVQLFVYDGNAMIAEYNASGTMLRRYVHGSNAEADDPLVWYEGGTVATPNRRILHADPRGSIIAVTDYRGQRLATNTYDEFGIPDTASGNDISTKGRFRYTGQAWLPELGMYYYKARIYSPTLGRFLQTDPIGYEDQFNLYAYVGNDPINGIDPTGEQSVLCTSDYCRNMQQAVQGKAENPASAAETTATAVTAVVAREGIGAEKARQQYRDAVQRLAPNDSEGRSAVKAQARAATPPITRNVIEASRPGTGAQPGSGGTANRTNSGADRLAGRLGTVGRAAGVAGLAVGATRIANSDTPGQETARVGGGVAGSLLGAELGAKVGLIAGPKGAVVGAIVLGIAGGFLGEKAIDQLLE